MSAANNRYNSEFRLHEREDGRTYVVRLSGELDLAYVPEVREAIKRANENDAMSVLIDIDELNFIDSEGLALLLETGRGGRDDGRIRMTRGTGRVAQILELTGLDEALPFEEPRST